MIDLNRNYPPPPQDMHRELLKAVVVHVACIVAYLAFQWVGR